MKLKGYEKVGQNIKVQKQTDNNNDDKMWYLSQACAITAHQAAFYDLPTFLSKEDFFPLPALSLSVY